MWMSAPTPVMSSTKIADSGSNSSPARTSRLPVEMKVNRSTSTDLEPDSPASWIVQTSPTTKATTMVATPSR
jgi:hypothetical protein